MDKIHKRLAGLFIGLVLWGFYFLQEEMAFYGNYTWISFRVHELSALIPYICVFATFVWTIALLKRIFEKKSDRNDRWFAVILVALLLMQRGYFVNQRTKVGMTMVVTIESLDFENRTMLVKAKGDEGQKVELQAPLSILEKAETNGQAYCVSYVYDKRSPQKGKLSSLSLIKQP